MEQAYNFNDNILDTLRKNADGAGLLAGILHDTNYGVIIKKAIDAFSQMYDDAPQNIASSILENVDSIISNYIAECTSWNGPNEIIDSVLTSAAALHSKIREQLGSIESADITLDQ